MKKYIISGIAVLAIAAVAAWNVGLSSQKNDGLSDVMLANVEALAQESGTSSRTVVCYSTYNSCWFWDCQHIWRCSGIYCYDVKCDAKSDPGSCH